MRDHTSRRPFRPASRLVALAAAALTLTAARAQQPEPKRVPVEEYVARSITRGALLDLRIAPKPSPADYQIASILLGLAHDLAPDDLDIVRRQIEAASGAGDKAGVLASTRELLAKEPEDTVAQLRLLTATILARTQNGEERSAVYESLLSGPRAKDIDPAVRSRLALDYALLLRESGDMKGFVQKLVLATQLDATNKEAHTLAATIFAEQRPDDLVGRLQMLEHLLMADPVDPNTHFAIARELVAGGAFKVARRFHKNGTTILVASGAQTDLIALENLVLMWHAEGPGAVSAQISKELTAARESAARNIRRAQSLKLPTDRMRKPEDIQLSIPTQLLFVMAVEATGDPQATAAAAGDLISYLKATAKSIGESAQKGQTPAEQAARSQLDLAMQMQMVRAWAGVQIDELKKDLERDTVLREKLPDQARVLEGWIALRSGQAQQAADIFSGFSEATTAADLGMAMAREQLGQKDAASELYLRVLRKSPLDTTGAWARTRLLRLGYQEDTKKIAELEAAVAGIDKSIGTAMVEDPRQFLQLSATLENPAPEGLDRTAIYLTLENASPFPMALGSDRAINSRFLVAPKMDNFNLGPIALSAPEVFDLNRRLRLMPHEKLRVKIWPDVGQAGWVIDALANRSIRIRWRIVQGFLPSNDGGFRPGPMCLSTETDSVVRRPIPEAGITPDGLAKHLAGDPPDALVRIAAAVRSNALQPLLIPDLGAWAAPKPGAENEAAPSESLRPAAEAIAKRYPTLPPQIRAMFAVILPHARLAPGLAAVDQAVAGDADPTVMCIALAFRVQDAADPLIARAKASDDPRVRQLADLVAERLTGKDLIYARLSAKDVLQKQGERKPGEPEGGK